jgi:hypothetical protein
MSRSFWTQAHQSLEQTVAQHYDTIPFFALRSVSAAEFSRIFTQGGGGSPVLASTFTEKNRDAAGFVQDLYGIGKMAFHAGVEETDSAGVLLLNLEQDVNSRPTWNLEKGCREDRQRLDGIETLPSSGGNSQFVALARVPLTAERVLCVIPPDSFRKIGWPDSLQPVPTSFVPQALISKVVELLVKRQQ